ncbi:MAG: hypothetical protein Q9171_000970 [Xanthocarpia ochracea]
MKSFAIAVLASILPFTAAFPFEKRVLVIETVTNVVVQTIDVTTTLWVKPGEPTPPAQINNQVMNKHAHQHAHKNKNKQNPPAQKAAPARPQSSPQEVNNPPADQKRPADQRKPADQKKPAVQKKPAAPAIPDTPKQADNVPQVPAPVSKAPAPPVPVPQTPAPQTPAPQVPAPETQAPKTPAPQPEPDKNADDFSGSTANCGEVGAPCSGDITFYDTGLGACGWTDDGTVDNVFALAHGMMGLQSNGNPFCGRKAEVTLDGKTVVGRLVDKCGGCEGQDIDLSHKMFQALANEDRGRISGVKWRFID